MTQVLTPEIESARRVVFGVGPDRLEVVVALRHIKAGVPRNGKRCPIALALIEDGHDVKSICAGDWWVDGRMYKVANGNPARQFVMDFDDERAYVDVTPERFVVEAVPYRPINDGF